MQNFQENEQENNASIDIKAELLKYLSHWRWFLFSTFITVVLAVVYLKFTPKIYDVSTTILIKEDNKSDITNQLAAFSDLGFGGSKNNIENEIEILKSRTLSEKVIDSINLDYSYFYEDGFKTIEIYKNTPIIVNFKPNATYAHLESILFHFSNIKGNSFDLNINDEKIGSFKFSDEIKFDFGSITAKKNQHFLANKNTNTSNLTELSVKYTPTEIVSNNIRSRTSINPTSKTSSVINIALKSSLPEEAVEYINTLVRLYNLQGIQDKRYIAQNTSDFISNRLNIIAEELGDVEKNVENYKHTNNLTDIQSEVQIFLDNLSTYERSVVENETEIKITNELISYLKKAKTDDLIPNLILNNNSGINSSIDELNKLILEKQRQSVNATSEHPKIIELTGLINSSKNNISASLINNLNSLKIVSNDLKRKEVQMQSKLSEVPKQEREFRIIDRQQKVKEALYLFLLQKREETNITLAATELTAKVIDAAIVPTKQVAPKSSIVLLGALIMGCLIPFVIIYLQHLLDTKIKTRLDIEGKTNIPFIGDIPTSETPDQIIELNSRSSSAEAIRIVRTNLDFMISDLPKEKCKVIFNTSTFPGEGKTFISANIAATFALSEKKTLLIGMDVRNPRLNDYFNIPTQGLTNYLSTKEKNIKEYIVKVPKYNNFDVLPAGIIPPNPAELLMSSRLEHLFEELKKEYDYIIVDTAPVSLVTDTLLIAKYADTFIYVIRANKLDKKFLNIPESLFKEKKLPRMSLLLNDTDSTKGYGYGYGYGSKKETKKIPLWKKILGID